jgi:hypothetical protein
MGQVRNIFLFLSYQSFSSINSFLVQRTVLLQVDTLWDYLINQALTPEEMETTFQWFEKEISLGRNEGNTVRFQLNGCAHLFSFRKILSK